MPDEWDDATSEADAPAEPAARDARAYLLVLQGGNVGEMYPIGTEPLTIGRSPEADVRLADEGVSRLHCAVRREGDGIVIEDGHSRNGTFCNGERVIGVHRLEEGDKLQVGTTTMLRFTMQDQADEEFQKTLLDAALRDGLTGAYNKRYLHDRLVGELRFAIRHRAPLSLMMFDLDDFKQLNDRHGHVAGDKVLAAFAEVVTARIRHEDVFARFGGEEFALLSRAIDPAATRLLADRLREAVGALTVAGPTGPLRLTVSIGVATLDDLGIRSAEELLEAADAALYRAKRLGKDRVVVCDAALLSTTSLSIQATIMPT